MTWFCPFVRTFLPSSVVNGRASGPVLQSVFLVVLAHIAVEVEEEEKEEKEEEGQEKGGKESRGEKSCIEKEEREEAKGGKKQGCLGAIDDAEEDSYGKF